MCSHILAQILNSRSFANKFANHPRQYFSYGYIYLPWVIVCPAPSMLEEKGFKKQIAPPTDQTSTLKGRGPRGPKVFISCTKNIIKISSRLDRVISRLKNMWESSQQNTGTTTCHAPARTIGKTRSQQDCHIGQTFLNNIVQGLSLIHISEPTRPY